MKDAKAGWKSIEKAGLVGPATSLEVKTGTWKAFRPVIDQKKCIRCHKCVVYCPDLCIEEKEGKIVADMDYCKGCALCAKLCPVNAIKMERVG